MTVWRSLSSVKGRLLFIPVVAAAALAVFLSLALSKDRNVLWTITHDKCVADEIQNNDPAPCAVVDLSAGEADGYVLLKDIRGIAQYLLIPTRRISGIEAPEILDPDLPNYWAAAWSHRDLLGERLGHEVAWDMIGLAINSQAARSQDQLHIHIDCLRPDVRDALTAHAAEIGPNWTKLSFDLAGKYYYARRLAAADLATQDPFKLLAEGVAGAHDAMSKQTLAVIGVTSPTTDFVLLAAPGAGDAAAAHSEDVLDHSCAVAQTHK
jgi:CDP-diacylglycerol pyrophosphatase